MLYNSFFLFCADCNWEIIPMLLGAWGLGFLFWVALYRKRYKARIAEIESSNQELQQAMAENDRKLEAEIYKHKKLTERYVELEREVKGLKASR